MPDANHAAACQVAVLISSTNHTQFLTKPPDAERNATYFGAIAHQVKSRVCVPRGRDRAGQVDYDRLIGHAINLRAQRLQTHPRGRAFEFAEAPVITKKSRNDNINILSPCFTAVGGFWKSGKEFKPKRNSASARIYLAGNPRAVLRSSKLEYLLSDDDFKSYRLVIAGQRGLRDLRRRCAAERNAQSSEIDIDNEGAFGIRN